MRSASGYIALMGVFSKNRHTFRTAILSVHSGLEWTTGIGGAPTITLGFDGL